MKRKFSLRYTSKFEKRFRTLSKDLQARIARGLLELEGDPYRGKRLHGDLRGLWSVRVGEYRVIYEIVGDKVILHRVDHRRRAY